MYLSAENMYKIKSKIVENNNSKETAWGLTNWFEFGFDRSECFTLYQRLASRTGVIFWCFSGERKQAGSERDVRVTTKGKSANPPPHSRDSLFVLA